MNNKSNGGVDIVQKHGYWTGRTFIDDAHSEGFSNNMSEEEKQAIRESDTHVTHCSVCGAMFDDRLIDGWKGCPRCFSILDLERPANAYFLAWEEKRKSMVKSLKRARLDYINVEADVNNKIRVECPACKTTNVIYDMGSHAETPGGVRSCESYLCNGCGGEFSVHYQIENDNIIYMKINYRRERSDRSETRA